MTESDDPLPSLEELQQRIDQVTPPSGNKGNDVSGNGSVDVSQAMRFTVELASGIAVGGAIGYFIDRWLHLFPLFFIIGFFLGAVAGFRNLIRDAKRIDERNKH